jgi:hypothetical protein
MSISAMKQALRALEDYRKHTAGVMIPQTRCQGDEAITALRQAIEQAEKQEPVGYAGVHIWIGDHSITRQLTKVEIQQEIVSGLSITNAAQRCLDLIAVAIKEKNT